MSGLQSKNRSQSWSVASLVLAKVILNSPSLPEIDIFFGNEIFVMFFGKRLDVQLLHIEADIASSCDYMMLPWVQIFAHNIF